MDAGNGRQLIERPRLLRLLDEAHVGRIALVAPAGHGKTVLARQWLAHGRTAGWFQARQPYTDVAVAIAELAAVAAPDGSPNRTRVEQILRASSDPPAIAATCASLIAADLRMWRERWLVIDDYHYLMTSPATEAFLEATISKSPAPLLLTSRKRPTWLSSRQIMYGEVLEIGRSALAMTPDETAEVLAANNARTLPGLASLAEGWPAVIGLAALAKPKGSLPDHQVVEELHTYFADELYGAAEEEVRQALRDLSFAPTITRQLLQESFANSWKLIEEEGVRLGFLTPNGAEGGFDLHPLLRSFLARKPSSELQTTETAEGSASIAAIARYYERARMWDDLFQLAEATRSRTLLIRALAGSFDLLMSQGRIRTAEEWLSKARASAPDADICAFADAELAFRRGDWEDASTIATDLFQRLSPQDPLLSKTFRRAAQSFHMGDRCEDALNLFRKARQCALTADDERQAIWGEIVTALEIDRFAEADLSIKAFVSLPQSSPEDGLRQAQARMMRAIRTGQHVNRTLRATKSALSLLEVASDPIVVTGSLAIYGSAFCLTASYDEALQLADRQRKTASNAGLSFVMPHCLVLRAAALVGLRRFGEAARILDEALQKASKHRDAYSRVNAGALYARLHLQNKRAERALEIVDALQDPGTPTIGIVGELLATRALALACVGRTDEARDSAVAARKLHSGADSSALGRLASFVADHRDLGPTDPRTSKSLETAIAEVHSTGNFDSFVCAYRSLPELLTQYRTSFASDSSLCETIQTCDPRLARAVGFAPRLGQDGESLTDREREVLLLIHSGMVNKEIAIALWITESTTKVHVRNILRKLGVRSRTAAAVRARELGLV
jgi:DNA-binding CsgD family transcriptional regulator/tetratricopeptide (TPR) repeat protein